VLARAAGTRHGNGLDGDRARRTAQEVVGAIYQQDFSALAHYLVAGTPQECAERLLDYERAGATSLQLNPACHEEAEDEMLELLAAEVLPALRA
jgi:alkanesulfonate monooxygenase SsuD/methylene tetrahydromethanopterin reductase-like flavin-dependent oxidoreductase (luciferase family)